MAGRCLLSERFIFAAVHQQIGTLRSILTGQRQQRFAYEAALGVISSLGDSPFRRIIARVASKNDPSIGLVRKLGLEEIDTDVDNFDRTARTIFSRCL